MEKCKFPDKEIDLVFNKDKSCYESDTDIFIIQTNLGKMRFTGDFIEFFSEFLEGLRERGDEE